MRNPIPTLTGLYLTVGLLAPVGLAYAARGGIDIPPSQTHWAQEYSLVRISGSLGCDSGRAPAGTPCALSIEDATSGKLFRLESASAADALKLYQNGTRDVTIEGRLIDPDTIRVSQARSL